MVPTINFPVIRGVQAGREYYAAMWTLKMLKQISIFDEDELPPELRAQRNLNKARIPEISSYILDNPSDYVFSALTVSIDSDVVFRALDGDDKLGVLEVPMEARFIINDGQHRRASILSALEQRPELAYETIAVVFFLDKGLERCQQMFADLNRHAIRPSRSLGLLYDHRNDKAKLAKLVVMKSEIFREIVDMEKSSLTKRSRKLFTLSAFYNACADLVSGMASGNLVEDADLAREYWEEVATCFPDWIQVREGKFPASELREGFIHVHGIALQALGKAGNSLLKKHPKDWKKRLRQLASLDWSRRNAGVWEGRTMIGGRISKATTSVTLTTNLVKTTLGLKLDEDEQRVENAHRLGRSPAPSKPRLAKRSKKRTPV
ncbi:DNA sulfur modification protein DndB [Luteolibacter marinus]|uniref:DNA sulfur modification protein DndB n=1 Tax=Luteolibacter marinus TaxID=2776705 RepID=UPI0018678B66|nr:DNA sulfur modification protein DndB [Luteolibacter marinus]